METILLRLIDETIEVVFNEPPTYEKRPGCPSSFSWRDHSYQVVELLSEHPDFARRGRSARNMTPAHISSASKGGSWGVGRYYFCVRVESGQIFEIYFDRAPKNAGDRKGRWFLMGERVLKNQ